MPGAELILGAVGFALAGPGVAIAFREAGDYIVKQVETIKNAPRLVREFQQLGRVLCEGQLSADIDVAERVFQVHDLNTTVKIALEAGLDKLRVELLAAETFLRKLVGKDGHVSRLKLALPPLWTWRSDAKSILRRFEKAQNSFQLTLSLAVMRQQLSATPEPLPSSRYAPIMQADGRLYTKIEPGSHLWQGSAGILDERGGHIRVSVIIERIDPVFDTTQGGMQAELPNIATHLVKNNQDPRILRCLGYQGEPTSQLVFQVPKQLGNPSTLRSTMLQTPRGLEAPGGGHPLEDRIRLAHLISESVVTVHTLNFVHKNIRPDTILLLKDLTSSATEPTSSLDAARPFLTYWSMLRKASDLSSNRGEMSWMRDIYRHPHRQGLQPQDRYNIGHDIYSLGVCLLEIGLWEPLTATKHNTDLVRLNDDGVEEENEHTLCRLYRNMAVELGLVEPADSESIRLLTQPLTVQRVLEGLAKRALPERMTTAYAEIVVACLTCLSGGFGNDVPLTDFYEHATSVAVRFQMLVVEALARMY